MKQTPAHSVVNHDLLALMPQDARRVVEVGCMHGALARAYREAHPAVHYTGIDIDPEYAAVAAQACSRALSGDVESIDAGTWASLFPSDCWVFGDCLEHLRDPWQLLRTIHQAIDPGGCVVACVPNAQHWSVQLRLASGAFRYEDSGLLDRTHLRWFTRVTLLEMFQQTGWRVESAISRRLPAEMPPAVREAIATLARAAGVDAEQALVDANAFQYLLRVRRD